MQPGDALPNGCWADASAEDILADLRVAIADAQACTKQIRYSDPVSVQEVFHLGRLVFDPARHVMVKVRFTDGVGRFVDGEMPMDKNAPLPWRLTYAAR